MEKKSKHGPLKDQMPRLRHSQVKGLPPALLLRVRRSHPRPTTSNTASAPPANQTASSRWPRKANCTTLEDTVLANPREGCRIGRNDNGYMKTPAISLFSGCGGSDLALQREGYDIRWSNDIWDVACDTYRDNIKSPRIETGDISQFENFPEAQLLAGCYPCQGYSQGGKRDWGNSINFLYREFDRVLRKVRPKAFVVENVNGMAFGKSRTLLENQLHRYRLAGYRVKWSVLNAKDFGVAQNRRRVFLVGIRSDLNFEYRFPEPTHGPGRKNPFVTQRDVLKGLPRWPAGEFNVEPFHWYYLSRKRRMPWGKQSPCIVGHWRHVPLHPLSPPLKRIDTDHWIFSREGKARRLSYRECALLQGFPWEFKWERGTARDRFQMIGNAVPPPLFSAVLKALEGLWGTV
jgi:DNA (cytosine-5)-methyltransferase 1